MVRFSNVLIAAATVFAGGAAVAQEAAPATEEVPGAQGGEVADPLQPPAVPPPPDTAPMGGAPAPAASAPQAPREEARSLATLRTSFGGLGGFGEVITPDVPKGEFAGRASFLWQHQNLRLGIAAAEIRAQLYVLQGAVGLMDQIEVSLSIPIVDYERSSKFGSWRDQDAGVGNPEVSVKYRAPLDSDVISLAGYVRVQLPWGEHGVYRPRRMLLEEGEDAEGEVGAAVAADLGAASVYMNLAARFIEEGVQTFRYRFGVSLQPTDTVELGLYYDGEEFEGSIRSNGFVGALATVDLGSVVLSAGADWLAVNTATDDVFDFSASDHTSAWSAYVSLAVPF